MNFEQQIIEGATGFPYDENKVDDFLNDLSKQRQYSFVRFKLMLDARFEAKDKIEPFLTDFARFLLLPLVDRRSVVGFSIFRIWFKQVASLFLQTSYTTLDLDGFSQKLNDFGRIKQLALSRKKNTSIVPGTCVSLARYNVDKWIAEVSPPTFTFPSEEKAQNLERESKFPLDFFSSCLEAVFLQIARTWPLLSPTIGKFVDYIVHIDLADFRSCSADRYIGVVFLTGSDTNLIDIEESLIHEFGHQVLYNIMELDPIVVDNGRLYKLPWSGSERDYYGYFHALYIYILLLTYFVERTPSSSKEQLYINQRVKSILDGCEKAETDFDETRSFTPLGAILFENLKKQIEQVKTKFN